MKKQILFYFSIFLIAIFLLNSCGINERMEKILRTDNSNWKAEEIDLSFSFYHNKNEYNAILTHRDQEYSAMAHVDINFYSLYFWFYDTNSNNDCVGTITFRVNKVIDDNTFTVIVDGSDFEIPKKITFHRIKQS